MLYRSLSHQLLIACLTLLSALPFSTLAQTKDDAAVIDPMAPIWVTVRIFQLTAPQGKYQPPTDQVFRVPNESHSDEARWMTSLKKTYPDFTPSVLHTSLQRIFRTSKSARVRFGQLALNSLEVVLNGAQSPGENGKPGTTLVTEINFNESDAREAKPITHTIQPIEVESGKTYFFASRSLKLSGEKYTGFVRQNAPGKVFTNEDAFFVFAFAVDLDKRPANVQYFTERTSIALQNDATKKVQPTLPAALQQNGLTGKITVNVEITPDGKVAKAITHTSNYPEANEYVVAAARQWEFPTTLFAQKKLPISGLLTFEISSDVPAPAPSAGAKKPAK
jgi:TonB family protein